MYNTKRPAYTDSEIAALIREKSKLNNDTIESLYNKYKDKYKLDNQDIIYDMLSGNIMYDIKMLKIASDYLNIKYDSLTDIIVDKIEPKFRKKNEDEDLDNFAELLNFLFAEMIRQEKLNK